MLRRRKYYNSNTLSVAQFQSSAQKIKTSYNNKYTVGVSPTPPTITIGTALAASTINGRSTSNPATATTLISNGYSAPIGVGITWIVNNNSTGAKTFARGNSKRFSYNGAKFDMLLSPTGNGGFGHFFRVRYSEDGGTTFMWGDTGAAFITDDSQNRYVLVDFGSAKTRIIEFIVEENTNSSGGNFESSTTVAAAPDTKPRMMMFGDSYTFGQGATFARDSMCYKSMEYLGVLDCYNQGLRSNGFANSNLGTQPFYHQRMDYSTYPELLGWGAVDLVVVNGTLNDNSHTTTEILTNATLGLAKIRVAQPNALIAFVNMTHSPDSRMSDPKVQSYRDAFTAALGTDPGAIMLDAIAENWIPVGAIGSSPYFPATGDTIHPNDAGHAYYGTKIGNGVMNLVNRILA